MQCSDGHSFLGAWSAFRGFHVRIMKMDGAIGADGMERPKYWLVTCLSPAISISTAATAATWTFVCSAALALFVVSKGPDRQELAK